MLFLINYYYSLIIISLETICITKFGTIINFYIDVTYNTLLQFLFFYLLIYQKEVLICQKK